MRLVLHVTAVLVGAGVAVAAVTVHRSVVAGLPLGSPLALAATVVTAWALRGLLPGLATTYAVGWLAAFGLLLMGRPEGDYAVAADVRGLVMVVTALVVLGVAVASLPPRRASSVRGGT